MVLMPDTTGQAVYSFCFLSPGERSMAVMRGETWRSGGAEAQVARLAMLMAERGHRVTMFYGSGGNGDAIELNGVRCVNQYPNWRMPASLLRFWAMLRVCDADVIYARLPDDFLWIPGAYAALHSRTTFVYALANDQFTNPWNTYDYHAWFHNPLYALGLRMAGAVAVQHERQLEPVRPYTRGRIVSIPNLGPALAEQVRPFASASTDVVWIAQIRTEKRLPILLDVASQLPGLTFTVVGAFNGALLPDEEALIHERMARLPNVTWLGPQSAEAIRAILADSKVLVNTSSVEGFPNTMLEAWSMGVPVVSLQVDPGSVIARCGLGLVSGTVTQLAHDLPALCQDEHTNVDYGSRGLAYVRNHHSPQVVVSALEQLAAPAQAAQISQRGLL